MSLARGLIATAGAGEPLDESSWRALWTGMRERTVDRDSIRDLLGLLCRVPPPVETFEGFVASVTPSDGASPPISGAVNVVGTGGGPSTLNISTAAALVAAASGVPVVKSGSRRYTSLRGSADMLDLLGITCTRSDGEVEKRLAADGIAFVGQHAYPPELSLLARRMLPLQLRPYGPFLNVVGPFLARVPVTAQVTGVSDSAMVPVARALGSRPGPRTWIVSNSLGVDELLGMADNVVETAGRPPVVIPAGSLTPGRGDLFDLAPVRSAEESVRHFLQAVTGRASDAVDEAVALNAAALIVASDGSPWTVAVARATRTMDAGDAIDLVPGALLTSGSSTAAVR